MAVNRIFLISLIFIFFQCGGSGSTGKAGNKGENFSRAIIEEDKHELLDKAIDISLVKDLDSQELRLIRNTILARYGYIFKSEDLQKHFKKFTWYKENKEMTRKIQKQGVSNMIDKQNIRLIVQMEKNRKDEKHAGETGVIVFEKLPIEVRLLNDCSNLQLDQEWFLHFKHNGIIEFHSNWEAIDIKGKWKKSPFGIALTFVRKTFEYEDESETGFKKTPDSVKEFGPIYIEQVTSSKIIFQDGSECPVGN